MADCKTCKAIHKEPESVPYLVHESAMARNERKEKRLTAIIVLLIVLFVGSNMGWMYYESQFEDVKTTYEANKDNGGLAIANGSGEVNYNGESQSNGY